MGALAPDGNSASPMLGEKIDLFLSALDVQGLRIDIEQRVRLNGLLLGLAAKQKLPGDTSALCRLITPIIAGSPIQQTLCEKTFNSLFGDDPAQHPGVFDPAAADRSQHDTHEEQRDRQAWLARISGLLGRGLKFGPIILLLGFVAYLAILGIFNRGGHEIRDATNPPATTVADVSKLKWIKDYPIEEFDPPQQAPWNRTLRWYYTEYDAQKWAAALFPFVIYVGFLGFLYHRMLAYLRREALKQNLRSLDWRLRGVVTKFGDRRLIGKLQPLRTLARTYLHRFDAEGTVFASAASGGRLQPRFKSIAVPIDYVVLIDRRSRHDHLAAYNMEVVRSLQDAGLSIEILEFNSNPTLCHFLRTGEFLRLDQVAHRFSDSVILIFAGVDQLISPANHRLLPAAAALKVPRRTVLITPESSGPESLTERELSRRLAVTVLRTSPDGVADLTRLLLPRDGKSGTRLPSAGSPSGTMAALVDFFSDRPGRWMQPIAPRGDDRRELQMEMRRAFEPRALRWLSTTAICPELRWPLTLSLKSAIGGSDRANATLDGELLAVCRLPWFRGGWMPDWTRTLFQQTLQPGEKHRINRVIWDAIGLERRASLKGEEFQIGLDENLQARRERVTGDAIMLNYLLPVLRSSHQLLAVPKSWLRALMRKPLQQLAIVAIAAIPVAAAMSAAALSLMPIDECDLLASSLNDNLRVGPGNNNLIFYRPVLAQRAGTACEQAVRREPLNGRFWYELARVESMGDTKKGYQDGMKSADLGYPAGYHAVGYDFLNGSGVPLDLEKARENYQMALTLGNTFSLSGLAAVAMEENRHGDAFKLLQEYYRIGGFALNDLAIFYRDDKYDFVTKDAKKYLFYLNEGARRGDGNSADSLGAYWQNTADPPDMQRANELFTLSARISLSHYAASQLAQNYMDGNGVDVDYEKATYWAIFGTKLNNADAAGTLADLIRTGNAVFKSGYGPQTSSGEVDLLRVLAGTGEAAREFQLGQALEQDGNLTEATTWYRKAAAQDYQEAQDALDRLSGANTR